MLTVKPGEISVLPLFLSTVTPGKFPTFWFIPVNALKRELFPLFGFPTRAICKLLFFKIAHQCRALTSQSAKITLIREWHLRNREVYGLGKTVAKNLTRSAFSYDNFSVFIKRQDIGDIRDQAIADI